MKISYSDLIKSRVLALPILRHSWINIDKSHKDYQVFQRFISKVKKTKTCWMWTAAICKYSGYGAFNVNGRIERAHRVSVRFSGRDIPEGMEVDHLCRNRACVNPSHLEVVEPVINSMRGQSGAARNMFKTHCDNGHEFTPENTYVRKDGAGRMCRICGKLRNRERKRQKIYSIKKDIICGCCGKPFAEWGKYRATKFCSVKCRNKVNMQKYLERHRKENI